LSGISFAAEKEGGCSLSASIAASHGSKKAGYEKKKRKKESPACAGIFRAGEKLAESAAVDKTKNVAGKGEEKNNLYNKL